MSILTTPKDQKSILVAVRSNNNEVEYAMVGLPVKKILYLTVLV